MLRKDEKRGVAPCLNEGIGLTIRTRATGDLPHRRIIIHRSKKFTPKQKQLAMSETIKKELAAYHSRMKAEHTDELYVKILMKLSSGKLYRDPSYTAKQLAEDLHTNTRYISTSVAVHTNDNYSALVNSLRLRDACRMLRSPRYAHYTAEEIGLTVGFSSRQSFYTAFNRMYKMTPRAYRILEEESEEM